MTSELVLPGDEIAAAEEYIPGDGTFEEDGTVFAAWLGELELDSREFVARVRPRTTTPCVLREGDMVLGRVRSIRKSFISVDVVRRVDQPDREIAGDTRGTLHISKISKDYIEDIDDALHIGDLIRAKVIEVEPAIQLTTKYHEYGIVKSWCPRCRTEMEAKGKGLVCPECDWKARGKVASDYGSGRLMPEV